MPGTETAEMPEVKPQLPKDALKVFSRMDAERQKGEKMNAGTFLKDLAYLDRNGVLDSDPEFYPYLQELGKCTPVLNEVAGVIINSHDSKNSKKVLEGLRWAELLGLDQNETLKPQLDKFRAIYQPQNTGVIHISEEEPLHITDEAPSAPSAQLATPPATELTAADTGLADTESPQANTDSWRLTQQELSDLQDNADAKLMEAIRKGEPVPPEVERDNTRIIGNLIANAIKAQAGKSVEAELPNREIEYYDQPWQQVFGPAKQIGEGASCHVFQPELDPVVIKVFDKYVQLEDHRNQLKFFAKLKGANHVVPLLGSSTPGRLPFKSEYLVEALIDAQDITDRFFMGPVFPLTKEGNSISNHDYKKMGENADYCTSSLEALGEIHGRGVALGDFRFTDILWDPQKRQTIIIDLGNAHNVNTPPTDNEEINFLNEDIHRILAAFFGKTKIGQKLGIEMDLIGKGGYLWPNNQDSCTPNTVALLKTTAQGLGAPDSLMKIINLMDDNLQISSGAKFHSAQEFADALKTYFKEVGLYKETQPATPADNPKPLSTADMNVVLTELGLPPVETEEEIKEQSKIDLIRQAAQRLAAQKGITPEEAIELLKKGKY